jgi:hypothetical protein
MMFVPHRKHLWASTACLGYGFTFLYVDDVRTSQGTRLWSSTACYRDSFTFLYVDDVRYLTRDTFMGHLGRLRGQIYFSICR